ncbi:TetR family transcriptional regulator [Luteimicrobium album]|uniref:TetR family transcriptional regulator n=1 Tax=Luteimicrobium album TaxID=1054550 RepID=A0ABQ6I3K2_9MICO|nr:TetR family transcriptional regulator [Luteimicrobium album]GMA25236.1 TetR family transcriptional regulator [Luteimicrobium album]
MATTTRRTERRTDALSRARIVEAAIEILDADGESALTFRALAARLATGSGAIYWHVANKSELLAAATDDVVARALGGAASEADPEQEVRTLALRIFDAIDAHPWVGSQLAREPLQLAMQQILEAIGQRLESFGTPDRALFDAASALTNYIVGVAGQNAANARLHVHDEGRTAFLEQVATRWTDLDAEQHPFLSKVAPQLADHDDREQFLAGVDLILAGIRTPH